LFKKVSISRFPAYTSSVLAKSSVLKTKKYGLLFDNCGLGTELKITAAIGSTEIQCD
jgi:hypothetical protein